MVAENAINPASYPRTRGWAIHLALVFAFQGLPGKAIAPVAGLLVFDQVNTPRLLNRSSDDDERSSNVPAYGLLVHAGYSSVWLPDSADRA